MNSRKHEDNIVLAFALVGLVFVVILMLSGCAPPAPACSPGTAQEIEVRYIAKAIEACAGYTYDDCPELPKLRAEAEAERQRYIECRK